MRRPGLIVRHLRNWDRGRGHLSSRRRIERDPMIHQYQVQESNLGITHLPGSEKVGIFSRKVWE